MFEVLFNFYADDGWLGSYSFPPKRKSGEQGCCKFLNEATPPPRFCYENHQILERRSTKIQSLDVQKILNCQFPMERSIRWPPVLLLPRSPYLIPVDVCDNSYNVKRHEIHINGKRHKRFDECTVLNSPELKRCKILTPNFSGCENKSARKGYHLTSGRHRGMHSGRPFKPSGTSVRHKNLITIKTERSDIPESTAAVGMPPPPGTVARLEVTTTGLDATTSEAETATIGVSAIGRTFKIT
ncbi:hypothetical protein CEXT_451221 [Caerostris extrusa]|uniref:Uncharacterized protein n=1 Tax=Caerostris extrusa TaxID=172846 RepID=A0AAV4QNR7_CAEEX|nr:hypothetical protein CEXT_451221 [Caerostris extrusa]